MLLNKVFAKRKEQGISLIEIMIAVMLSIMLLGGLIKIYSNIYGYSYRITQYNQLLFELQQAMDMMIKDIRRAGFWGDEESRVLTSSTSNPFTTTSSPNNDIAIQSIGTGTNNCILFTYDYNKNGAVGNTSTVNTNEHFGYKLANNVLYTLTTDQNYNCTSDTNWEGITTPNLVMVTNLNFSLTNSTVTGTTKTMAIRSMTITLTGQLTRDTTMQATLQQNVLIRGRKVT